MRHAITYSVGLILAALFSANFTIAQTAAPTEDLEFTVTYLLDFVAKSDCTFLRNGKSHAPKEASEHMKGKYEHFKKEIKTPEDFIRLAASKSLMTGQAYLVKAKDGKEIDCAEWLTKVLDDYRESRKKLSVVELPRPNSGTFSFAQAEARKSEILSNAATSKLEAWKNPYMGFCVHVHRDDTLTVYGHGLGASQPKQQRTRAVAEIKQMAAEIPLDGNPAGILITSEIPLKESKVFPELLNALFKPSIQLFYARSSEPAGAANGSQPSRSETNSISSAADSRR